MISYTRRGEHVQIRGYLETRTHTFTGKEQGVILGETDNGVGRMLASVEWTDGDWGPVFSDEVQEIPQ